MHLDPAGAEQGLIDLLPEQEYVSDVTAAMARNYAPRAERPFDRTFRYDLMWAAREGRTPTPGEDQHRTRFAAALNAEMRRLRAQNQDGRPGARMKELAKALAAVDARGSAAAVLDEIATPDRWEQYACLEAAERLLMAGVALPVTTAFALVDSILQGTEKWMQDSDKYELKRNYQRWLQARNRDRSDSTLSRQRSGSISRPRCPSAGSADPNGCR